MSIHMQPNEETLASLAAQRRNSTIASILVGILLMILLSLVLWLVGMKIFTATSEPIVAYEDSEAADVEIEKVKITTSVKKTPPSQSSVADQVLTVQLASSFSLPTTAVKVDSLSTDFGESEGFGDGWGAEGQYGASGGGDGVFTLFGRKGGGGLSGSFYDFKQDRNREITDLGRIYVQSAGFGPRTVAHKREIKRLVAKRFSDESLKDFYKAETDMSFTHLAMKNTSANAAPKAFNVEKEVQPSGWIVKYEGKITPPQRGYYRFVGRYDDILIIYLNDKIVFDGSWSDYTGSFESGSNVPGPSLTGKPMRASKYVRIRKGDELKIIIGESPGGSVGGGILIQQKGKKYKTGTGGALILPPFATEPIDDSEKERLKSLPYPIEVENVPVFTVR